MQREISDRFSSTPRVEGWPLGAIGLLLAGSLIFTAWVQFEKSRQPEMSPIVAVLESRELVFSDSRDGDISVQDARTGERLQPIVGEAGFARGALRGLAQARLKQGGSPTAPFELRRESDGALRLIDHVTGRSVDLTVFGPNNYAVFQAYLAIRKQP
jgi:putative photosynthetic complex assembly protein